MYIYMHTCVFMYIYVYLYIPSISLQSTNKKTVEPALLTFRIHFEPRRLEWNLAHINVYKPKKK